MLAANNYQAAIVHSVLGEFVLLLALFLTFLSVKLLKIIK